MNTFDDKLIMTVKAATEASEAARLALRIHQSAVDEALERKRKLGQYWVVWDGEKPVEVHPGSGKPAAAE